jgi:hypothetical protein
VNARLRGVGPRLSARLWQLGAYWSFGFAMIFLALFLLGLTVARFAGADLDSNRSTVGPFLIRLPQVTIVATLVLAVCTAAVRPALAREQALGYTTLPFSDLPFEVRDWRSGAVLRGASAEPLRRRADLRARLRRVRASGVSATHGRRGPASPLRSHAASGSDESDAKR